MLNELKLSIKKEPFQPSISFLQENIKKYPPNYLHDSWKDFLYWDTELEPQFFISLNPIIEIKNKKKEIKILYPAKEIPNTLKKNA